LLQSIHEEQIMQKQPTDHPLAIRKYTAGEARDWMVWEGVALADVVNEDETPAVKLGAVGFLRAPWGVTTSFEFPYDEVLVVTRGRCTVTSGKEELTAGRGEVIYLPAGIAGSFRTEEDTELVYVASSPYGEVNRQVKAELLGAAE
jgi:ethanolamine utilization protein EutQ (cupin superfamily)